MILEVGLLILAIGLLYFKLTQRPKGLPPGDWGWPFIGRLPSGRNEMDVLVAEQRKKYGNTFSMKMGSRIVVFLTDYKTIKTAFSKPEFSGRPNFYTFSATNYFTGYGLSFSNGRVSQENRRFTLKTLRDFGMGKSKLEHVIQSEITELLQDMSKKATESLPLDWLLLQVAVLNVIWKISANKRYDLSDNEIQSFFKASTEAEEIMNGSLLDFFPWTENLPNFIKNRFMHADRLITIWDNCKDLMNEAIEEHRKTFDKDFIRDYIDMYLLNMEEEGTYSEEDSFKHDLLNLNALLMNIFVAGSDTSAQTLQWFLLYMVKYPKIQRKIQEEIDTMFLREKLPELQDKDSLPYLDATLYEVNRCISLLPNAIVHMATMDAELEGYKIPQGTLIVPCVKECHMSPEYFESPQDFYPERFLDSNGKVNTKKEGYLPFSIGDWGWPIIGRLPTGRNEMDALVAKQRKKYGNTFSMKMGSQIVVFLTDYKTIKNAFSKPEFSGRPNFYTFSATNYFTGYGLTFASGHVSQENRRFTLKTLRDFGMGKSKLEQFIQSEITELLQDMSKKATESSPLDWLQLQVAVLNVFWKIIANKRYDLSDNEIQSFFKANSEAKEIMNGSLLDYFPWTENLPNFIKNKYLHADKLIRVWDISRDLMNETIEEHTKTFDKDLIRDLIDMYLLNIEEDGACSKEDNFKHDLLNLNIILLNIFFAGSDTTAVTLQWFLLYMCKYPKIQKKIQEEMDSIFGREKLPELQDKDSLPYLDATLHEVNRCISLVPNALLHMATMDTELEGYRIPQGTLIVPCLKVCHMSPEYFESPQDFLPERFLDSKGKVNTKMEGYLPFSIGRRVCVGESLAKTEVFLFAYAILKKFDIIGGKEAPDLSPDVGHIFINVPKPYKVFVQER